MAGSNVPKGRRLVDFARADGMRSILHNPIHTLETTTTGCHAEAQTMCDLEENHDPGRIRCFPLDRAAIREPARGVMEGHDQRPDTRPIEDPAEKSQITLAKQGASTH
ncbi:hypothetical protein DQW77_17895, partial [Roseovarius sp. TE539]